MPQGIVSPQYFAVGKIKKPLYPHTGTLGVFSRQISSAKKIQVSILRERERERERAKIVPSMTNPKNS
jgi:hypothetical protein